jgi:hypothetical protein
MSSVPVFVGIDYHQNSVQVCVLDADGKKLANRSVENNVTIVAGEAVRFGQPKRVAIEACCEAANLADELITQRELPVELAHVTHKADDRYFVTFLDGTEWRLIGLYNFELKLESQWSYVYNKAVGLGKMYWIRNASPDAARSWREELF